MRLVLLTTTVLSVVEDEEEAASIALGMDEGARLNMERVLEVAGADHAMLEPLMEFLGTSVTMIPERFVSVDD